MTAAIRTEGLTKFYRKTLGIDDLDLEVRSGEVFGFLGPNGAGKTTTIRLLLDLLRPTRGAAQVLGMDVRTHSVEIRRRVGYLPGELGLYERLTAWELLTYFAHLRGLDDLGHARELAGRLDLDTSRPVRTLSHGNRQKVGLVQAFMHRPRLLVLDEPTGGLDPLIQHEFYGLLREVRDDGATVFLSSHVLVEVERVADRVGIIRDGRLVEQASVEELKERALRRLELHFGQTVPASVFRGMPGVRDIAVDDHVVRLVVEGSLDAVIKAAAAFEVVNVVSPEADLEEVFLSYYTPREDSGAA
jgi:ABC-2 type transport system ATP-binding protein